MPSASGVEFKAAVSYPLLCVYCAGISKMELVVPWRAVALPLAVISSCLVNQTTNNKTDTSATDSLHSHRNKC